jgi:hypothetical protein
VPAGAGHDVDAGSGAGLSADHKHRARGLVALDRKARALAEQLVKGLVSGSAIRIMCSKALTPSWTYPTCASRPEALDAQRDGTARRVKDDLAVGEQAELAGRGGAVEHRVQAALHVRGTSPDDLPVAAFRLEPRDALGRDDVEVSAVLDELRGAAGPAAHDRRRFQISGRR